MYSPANFAPLSKASLAKLLKGLAVRVKHGSGLKLHLSKVQQKKHLASKAKGQGGYNLTLDPFQASGHMQGEGFFEDIGRAFVSGGKNLASTLIHQGIPMTTGALGGLAGSAMGTLAGNPMTALLGGVAGEELGKYGGYKLSDYVGEKTGYGMFDILKKVAPFAVKAIKNVGTELLNKGVSYAEKKALEAGVDPDIIDLTKKLGKKVLDKGLSYAEKKAKEHGFDVNLVEDSKDLAEHATKPNVEIEPELAVREVLEGPLRHHPSYKKVQEKMRKMFGHGMKGGTLLIDRPFSFREFTNAASSLSKDPMAAVGYGLGDSVKLKGGNMKINAQRLLMGRPDTVGKGLKKMKGKGKLIDEPFTFRQMTDAASRFNKDPLGTIGYGFNAKIDAQRLLMGRPDTVGKGLKKMKGKGKLIDEPFTFRQMTDAASRFNKDPLGTIGYGVKNSVFLGKDKIMSGKGKLIDEPFTFRQFTDAASNFNKDPLGTIGYGVKKRGRPKRGAALLPAGYR